MARNLAIPLVLALALYSSRTVITQTWCAVTPTPCVEAAVNSLDRIAFRYGSIQADFTSNVVQNTLGALLFVGPFVLAAIRKSGQLQALLDSLGFLIATLWNFAIMEAVRAVVQRPRPLVFQSPLGDGANVHQYTSFYSGHTSFAALATISLYLYCRRLFPLHRSLQAWVLGAGFIATLWMACLRVMGGRHYPTDVIAGAAFGWSIGYLVQRYLNPRSS